MASITRRRNGDGSTSWDALVRVVGYPATCKSFRSKLAAAGFEQIDIEPTRVYRAEDAREMLSAEGVDVDAIAPQIDGKFMSAFVRAVKPAGVTAKACCGPSCCN